MNKRTITAIGVTIIVAITVAYFYLGGMNSVEYTIENVGDYNLVGVPFQGKGDSKEIEEAFFEAKRYLDEGTLEGVLTIVHYQDSTLAEEEQKLFIGIKLNRGASELPLGYERLTIPAQRTVRATIEAHNVVMPSPETIENNIREKALELNIAVQDFTIEQYVSEKQLLIDMPAR